MTARLLRERYTRAFRSMERYPSAVAWTIVTSYVMQIVLAASAGAWLLSGAAGPWTGLALFALVVFIGTRFRGLNNIVHECSHATFAEERSVNVTVGKLCSALTLGSFTDYRHEHLSHHAHLGDYERDLDLQGIEGYRLHDQLTASVVLRHIVTPLMFRHLPAYLSINLSSRDGRGFQSLKIALLGVVTALTVAFPLTSALFILFPYVVVYSALNYWADCIDHAGLVPTEDDLDGSRNMLAPRLISWFLFPRNDGYHLVHHLFPQVPARHLPKAHEALLEDAVYCAAPNAVRGTDRKPATANEELAGL